ncbi:hypothetical protein EVAR_96555_1 [Eumeta japonica]|uniref:Uncharacterized protein n=1 Tax=Eumeta variegata TaxID=151549 RepID=A0A4C1WGJ2_EUMVA|nr:hypothetical protein EVAR_96555_1 [Eumeta japonica]
MPQWVLGSSKERSRAVYSAKTRLDRRLNSPNRKRKKAEVKRRVTVEVRGAPHEITRRYGLAGALLMIIYKKKEEKRNKMDSPKIVYKYYSNPAFCGQSEVVFSQKTPCVSSKISAPDRPRMPPLGANSPRKAPAHDRPNHRLKTDISDNPLRIAKYSKDEPPELPPKPAKFTHSRTNSSTSFQRQSSIKYSSSFRSSTRSRSRSEELEMSALSLKQRSYLETGDGQEERTKHRYEVIADDLDDIADYSPTKKRIVEADADEIEEYNVDGPDDNEMKEIPTEIVKTVNGKIHRYAIVPTDDEEPRGRSSHSPENVAEESDSNTETARAAVDAEETFERHGSQPSVRMMNRSSDSPRVHQITPSKRITSSTPTHGVTPSKSCANLTSRSPNGTSPVSPKALQKLSYGMPEILIEATCS